MAAPSVLAGIGCQPVIQIGMGIAELIAIMRIGPGQLFHALIKGGLIADMIDQTRRLGGLGRIAAGRLGPGNRIIHHLVKMRAGPCLFHIRQPSLPQCAIEFDIRFTRAAQTCPCENRVRHSF